MNNIKTLFYQFNLKNIFNIFLHSCTKGYFKFSGRASRKEYLIYFFITFLINLIELIVQILAIYCKNIFFYNIIFYVATIINLFFFIPGITITVRRLHDFNMSGYYILLSLFFMIIIYGYLKIHLQNENDIMILLFISMILYIPLLFFKGTPGTNKYGEPPS